MYQVIIVEDDPMVAAINKQYVELTPSFSVIHTFKSGIEALEYFKTGTADLVILDYYTPLMNGEEFIDKLHSMGCTPAIIMVTSANDADIVRRLFSRGVIDYLVKPFEFGRFKAALERFAARQEQLNQAGTNVAQSEIDRLFAPAAAASAVTGAPLSKGLNENTLTLIRNYLNEHRGDSFSSEQIAEQVHLSRITIRRYMNYMVETGELISTIDYQTGGRPSIKYRCR